MSATRIEFWRSTGLGPGDRDRGGHDTVTFDLPSALARLPHDHTATDPDAVSRRPAMVRALSRKAP